jgi:ABC-2 type transport system ATP-binding protein
MSDSLNILEIEGLCKTYESGHRAIDGLTLRVPRGSIFGFLGLNGAGKTSTIRIVAGLSQRDAGTIHLFGADFDSLDSFHKTRIGFVLDEPLYFDWMTAAAYLEFVGVMYGLAPDDVRLRTQELLDFFDLREMSEEIIANYSTGMKKKVSLAAAIIHKPELIILDEPLEGIDALAANAIKESLTYMASKGATVFITSHVLDTIERLCTDLAIIHQGKTILQCRTSDIRSLAKRELMQTTYASLEELFVDLLSGHSPKQKLSWI